MSTCRNHSSYLARADHEKIAKYQGICNRLRRAFLPAGLTVWGSLGRGTHKLLEKVASAAHESGFVLRNPQRLA